MVTTFISAKDLELIALREIRAFPGGEYVVSVELEVNETEGVGDKKWTLTATVRDGADLDSVQHAVSTTSRRLKHRYSLRTDW